LSYVLGLEPDAFRCKIPECEAYQYSFNSVGGGSESIFPFEEDDDEDRDYCKHYPIKMVILNKPFKLRF